MKTHKHDSLENTLQGVITNVDLPQDDSSDTWYTPKTNVVNFVSRKSYYDVQRKDNRKGKMYILHIDPKTNQPIQIQC